MQKCFFFFFVTIAKVVESFLNIDRSIYNHKFRCIDIKLSRRTPPLASKWGPRMLHSDFDHVEFHPEKIAAYLMKSLELNDFPDIDSGLKRTWNFSTDTLRAIFDHNMTDFISCAHKTADEFPTSFYGSALKGRGWELERPLVMVGGNTTDCWIATHLMRTTASDGRVRRWQWELRSFHFRIRNFQNSVSIRSTCAAMGDMSLLPACLPRRLTTNPRAAQEAAAAAGRRGLAGGIHRQLRQGRPLPPRRLRAIPLRINPSRKNLTRTVARVAIPAGP